MAAISGRSAEKSYAMTRISGPAGMSRFGVAIAIGLGQFRGAKIGRRGCASGDPISTRRNGCFVGRMGPRTGAVATLEKNGCHACGSGPGF